jgi:AAA domain
MSAKVAALVDFVTVPQWVAWRNEMRNGQWTKVPYCSATRQAEADDASTWLPHDQAALIADVIVNGSGGGIGIELGQCGERWIIGVDLDTCRDPVTGIIEPWAATVIERLNSYAEVSPSETGVKQFFLVDPADVPALRRIMGTAHGRQFKRANGSSHPPSIELYLSNRYFTVTWEGIPDAPAELRVVPLEDLRWLIEDAGPNFSGKRDSANSSPGTNDTSASILDRLDIAAKHSKRLAAALLHASTMRGGSRSEGAFGLGAALKRAGWTFEDMKAALRACPATRDWAEAADERQFERIWARSDDQTTGEQHTGQPKPDAIWVDAEDWEEADIPPRPWIVPGYALRGAVTLIAGPPSALKSSLALGWASSVALNVGYGRFHPAVSGPVFVYNVEDDDKEQRRRLSATLRQFGARPADIKNKLYRIGPSTIGTLLERCDDGRVRFTPAMDTLHTLIRMKRPVMFIVDPLAELHNCEENDNTALRAIIAKFREMAVEFEMAVVVLHHTRKGAGQSPGDPDAARGASAIIGAVRVAVTATTMSEDDAKAFGLSTDLEQRSYYVRMDDAKSNYAPLRSAQWFEKVAYELTNGDIVAAAVPWKPPEEKIASLNDLTVLAAAIERGAVGGEPWSPKLSSDPRSVRALLEQHGFLGTDAQKKTLARLETEFGMTTGTYRRSRNKTAGLRIGDKPEVMWVDEPQ